MPKRVMISAGEASGELYGAFLTRAIRKLWPDTEIIGIGGRCMKDEGVHLLSNISGSIGLTETIMQWRTLFRSYQKAKEALINQKPEILVVIDFPDFNMALAKKAKSAGIPVLYYVSPQVWAWRAGRVKKIASLADKIAVLFPFEVDIYKSSGLPCEFVGHPIAETIDIKKSKNELKAALGIDPNKKVISFLPGSRPAEIKHHFYLIKDVSERILKEMPDFQVVVPLITGTKLEGKLPGNVIIVYDRTPEAVACSDATAVASGTATLEAALLGVPMVVFYRMSALTVFFGRLFIKVRFISLVNLLSGREVVLELIQKDANADKIFAELKRILKDHDYRANMLHEIKKIKKLMGSRSASSRVASMVGEIAGWSNTSAY